MTDKFAGLEDRSRTGVFAGVLFVCALVAVFLLARWPGATPRSVSVVVQSAGAISVPKIEGGTREAASVRLDNGNLVMAYVGSGGPLAPGDKVRLIEQSRFLGGPVYQVVAKDAAH